MGARDTDGPPRLDGAEWLLQPSTRTVFSALQARGQEARAVGGAVRNALIGMPVKDVDIATAARPEEVVELAAAARLKTVPTGFEHGTVTVIADNIPYEVTTLRKDVETFGRHANVAYTTDWAEDARRRDFTINALYCASDGAVYDPLGGGWPDLKARRVRFIGEARDRIREDYLRILRFFRFTAEYSQGIADSAGVAACVAERDGLAQLSAERVRAELLKLLAAPGACPAAVVMEEHGLLQAVLGAAPDVAALSRLAAIEAALGRAPDAVLRLRALAVRDPEDAARLKDQLRLSRSEHERLAQAVAQHLDGALPEEEAKRLLYRMGVQGFTDTTLLAWAHAGDPADSASWRAQLLLPDRWPPPALPFRGADFLALGVGPGPQVGRALAELEAWWVAEGFPSDAQLREARLREIAARYRGS